jgi:hypothetical protein
MAVTEPNRSQSPLCLCKAAPTILPSLVPAPSPEDGSQLFVALAGRLVQMRLGVGADRDDLVNARVRETALPDAWWRIGSGGPKGPRNGNYRTGRYTMPHGAKISLAVETESPGVGPPETT